jgi:hypothetical protein
MASEGPPPSRPRATAQRRRRSAIPRLPPGQARWARPANLDWAGWIQLLQRRQRVLSRQHESEPTPPPAYFINATCTSFTLDGIAVTEQEVAEALAHGPAQRKLRSRAAQRIRNHVAILHSIESSLRRSDLLKTASVIRWYTSISSGLSTNALGDARTARLDGIARRINSPQLRLQPALQEIVRMYADLLVDPLFPSFNGILSRLLLRYHLGRCGLPFAVIGTNGESSDLPTETTMAMRLLNAIDDSYGLLLG